MNTRIAPALSGFAAELAQSLPDEMSAYFLKLEGLLSRLDSATTYYQVLGIERSDGLEKIESSFQQLLNLLFPPYSIGRTLPPETSQRIERAFQKVSQAFGVLASFARREEYDRALLSIGARLAPERADSSVARPEANNITLNRTSPRGVAYRESSEAVSGDNRRRCGRFKLSIPVRVTGNVQVQGKWHEMTETIDVSRTGLRLRLHRRVMPGTMLYLTLPLPSKLRAHGFAEQGYNVYGLVRRVEPAKHGIRAVGVEFIGEHPPAGFLDEPWAVFRPRKWGGNERRRPDRYDHIESVMIEYFDESMHSISREEARTENVSRYGVRLSRTTAPAEFDLVAISCPRLRFECMAKLRSRYTATDGLERICVQIIDKEWPLRS